MGIGEIMGKRILYSKEASDKIINGANLVWNGVKITLGPKGENVIIGKSYENPLITNDGVTIAREIELEDEFENIGARVIIEAAEKTQEESGDGTSTAVIVATEILNKASMFFNNVNKLKLKDELLRYRNIIDERLENYTINVRSDQMIQQVATISANNDSEMGEFISRAIKSVGRDGIINVEESNTTQTFINKVDGMKIPSGFISPYFINDEEKLIVDYENVSIAIIDKKIFQLKDLMKLLQEIQKEGNPLLLIADNVEGEALSALVVNKLRANLRVVAVRAPGLTTDKIDNMEDLAAIVGATVISEGKGHKVENEGMLLLGKAKKVIVSKDSTIIREGAGDTEAIKQRILSIKGQIKKAESDYEKQKLRKRLANLSTGVAILKIGAGTEVEMKEKKIRIDDALNATKAALDEGILPGGGVVLYMIGKALLEDNKLTSDENIAALRSLEYALKAPLVQLLKNSGLSVDQNVAQIELINDEFKNTDSVDIKQIQGIDMKTGKPENMVDSGIIDPTKVVRSAVKNAITVAAMLISTGCIIGIDKENLDKNQTMMAPTNRAR